MTRSISLQSIEALQGELEDLRLAHDRVANIIRLHEVLCPLGLEVLGYEGPARYELGQRLRCEICGELIEEGLAYELRLLSSAWGPRYGYLHRRCFDQIIGRGAE